MLELRAGRSTATIHPAVGGRLGALDLGTGQLLRGPGPGIDWAHWGCFPLVPWSNRIPGGHLRLGAVDAELPVNWADGSAIHGLGASCAWAVVAHDEGSAELAVHLGGGPYRLCAEQSFDLRPDELRLRLRMTNEGDAAVPAGLGIHPWFHHGPVRVPADERWPGEPLPTGPPEPVSGSTDLRHRTVPVPMDACFTELTGTSADVPGAQLSWDGPVTNVVVYSGEPGWVCVEPVTMANDGFGLAARDVPGHGVQIVEPGASLAVTYRFIAAPSS